ncbi:MAG: ABC transporter permease subunit [Alphaproteobacteria bacterium]|nr:ABC transporter permease subunit [Alphaproteobacteria bacterium]
MRVRMRGTTGLRAWAWQALALACLAAAVWWLASNALANLEARRINSGFDFLQRPAAMPIGESVIAYRPGDSNLRAIVVGLLNTLLVSALGIALATPLGVAIGIARLSRNWLLARLASGYVEYVRNVPLLAHLFLLYILMQGLPSLRAAWSIGNVMFLSNRGLVVPALAVDGPWWPVVVAIAVAFVTSWGLHHHADRAQVRTGRRPPVLPWGIVLSIGGVALALAIVGTRISFGIPRLDGLNFAGGWTLSPELTTLVVGLSLYAGAFIAEIVRGGILAISPGQWEAGYALGLERRRVLRLIVLPQALRLIVPPTTNQYLDLAKSSSLAIAIGYPDLVAVINSIITDTGQAIEAVAMIIAAFLMLNLGIAALMNWWNARIAPAGWR